MSSFLWNTRGNLVFIEREKDINDAISRGFVQASEEDVHKYKPGHYHPAYDRGDNPRFISVPKEIPHAQKNDVLEVIEI